MRFCSCWLGGIATALALGCTPDIPRELPPNRIVAEYDPSIPSIPLPNDLAIDSATGRVAPVDAPGSTPAEKELNTYLRTLDGFPLPATATCSFSGPLAPGSVSARALVVLDLTDPARVQEVPGATIEYEAAHRRIRVRAPFERDRRYAVGLLGGSAGLRGEAGEEVVGAPLFVFLRAPKSLATCADLAASQCSATTSLLAGPDDEEERARVVALERARRQLQPALGYLETHGVERDQLVALWSFRTVHMALASFDLEAATPVIPFPNDFLLENGRVKLPADPTDDAPTRLLKAELNKLDGFSTTASLRTESSATVGAADLRLDAASLLSSHFVVANLDRPDETVAVTVRCRSCGTATQTPGGEPDQIALLPNRPLRSHTRYAAFWLRGAKTLDGRAVNAPAAMALLRLSAPLVRDDRSELGILDDATATALEPYRLRLQPALAWADAHGLSRTDILLAWGFTTQTTSPALVDLAQKPQGWNVPTGMIGGPGRLVTLDTSLLDQLSAYNGVDFSSELRWAKEGEFTGASALDPYAEELDLASNRMIPTEGPFRDAALAGAPRLEPRRFVLLVPKRPKYADGRIPVVIFQHGLGRARRDAALIGNQIAKAGYATLAIDAPFHGLRSFCQDSSACRSGTSCVEHRCPDALETEGDGYAIGTVGGPFGNLPDPSETPTISGNQFISSTHLTATRDHFRQQVIDLGQLLRVLADTAAGIGAIDVDDPATSAVHERLDPTAPRYIGVSLGGILGALAAATLPDLPAATLNVPGASLTDIVLFGDEFVSTRLALLDYLASRGMPEGSQAYEDFLDIARWAMDPADPQNFGRHLVAEPLSLPGGTALPRKRVFISWVKGDTVIPNNSTELLIRSIEVGAFPAYFASTQYVASVPCPAGSSQTQCGDHGFLLNILSTARARLASQAQAEAVGWVNR